MWGLVPHSWTVEHNETTLVYFGSMSWKPKCPLPRRFWWHSLPGPRLRPVARGKSLLQGRRKADGSLSCRRSENVNSDRNRQHGARRACGKKDAAGSFEVRVDTQCLFSSIARLASARRGINGTCSDDFLVHKTVNFNTASW